MKFDFVAFLGGLTVGAATAALFSSLQQKPVLGHAAALAGGAKRVSMHPHTTTKRPTVGPRRGWL